MFSKLFLCTRPSRVVQMDGVRPSAPGGPGRRTDQNGWTLLFFLCFSTCFLWFPLQKLRKFRPWQKNMHRKQRIRDLDLEMIGFIVICPWLSLVHLRNSRLWAKCAHFLSYSRTITNNNVFNFALVMFFLFGRPSRSVRPSPAVAPPPLTPGSPFHPLLTGFFQEGPVWEARTIPCGRPWKFGPLAREK